MLLAAEPGTLILLIVVIPLVVILARGLANPRSRPFILGLLGIGLAAFVFLGFVGVRHTRMVESNQMRVAVENQRASVIYSPGTPPGYSTSMQSVPQPPGYSSMQSAETSKPRKPKSSAASTKVAKADNSAKAVKPAAADKLTKPATPPKDDSDDDAPQPPPAWVKGELTKKNGVYFLTRQTDPYSTTLECDRDVPAALQSAVSEYAQLLLGNDQAKNVRLPEDDLQHLERDRWVEPRTIEVGGETKRMHTLHLLIGFDPTMQQEIRMMAENATVAQRLKGAGVVLGGVLGLLALVWGGLSFMGSRQDVKLVHEAAAPVAVKVRARLVFSTVAVACLLAVIIAIVLLAFLFLS